MLYTILVQFKLTLGWIVGACSTHSIRGGFYRHSIHKAQMRSIMGTKGISRWGARWWFWNQTKWDYGGGHVALCIITSWALIYLGFSAQICCVGSRQWWWEFSSYARSSYTRLRDWFKKTSEFDFEYSSNMQLRLFPLCLRLAQRLLWFS